MASKALAQIINETWWPDLDYLVIDMPPGTGDIQLTPSSANSGKRCGSGYNPSRFGFG